MSNRDKMCDLAQEQNENGSIYVSGGQGQTEGQITEAWITRMEKDATNRKRAIALWLARLAAGFKNLRAFDCSGLVNWILEQLGLYEKDRTANRIYFDLCEVITRAALAKGDLVFKKYLAKNQMYHVGIYMGDGTVIHSKGRDYGVVREAIGATGWNRYGRLKCLESVETTSTTWTCSRVLKLAVPRMKGEDVYNLELALEALGCDCGMTKKELSTGIGIFGSKCNKALRAWQKLHPECGTNGKPDGKAGEKSVTELGGVWQG